MSNSPWNTLAKHARIALAFVGLAMAGPAAAQVTVNVVDLSGAPITNGFRWLLEEDNTYGIKKTAPDGPWAGQAVPGAPSLPGTPSPNTNFVPGAANPTHTLSVNVHKSHAPVVCAGNTVPANAADGALPIPGPSSVTITPTNCPGFNPARNYHVSVLPWRTSDGLGYTQTGRNIAAGQRTVTAVVQSNPQPTALITVLVFEDNQPINAAYDQPEEQGLANFTLLVSDMAGLMKQDAYTYPLGTTYKYACTLTNGAPCRIDASGNRVPVLQGEQPEFQMDPDTGLPVVDFLGDGNITTCPGPLGPSGTLGYTRYQLANCIDPYTRTPFARGEAVIRYTSMNKYAVEPVPPPRLTYCGGRTTPLDCSRMLLTGTLEGTRQNDAWVRAGEPRYNIALGQLNWLVFYGFVNPMNSLRRLTPGPYTGQITGRVVQVHEPHPPNSPGLTPGLPVPDCFVGLNNLSGNDEQVYTAPCNPDSTFNITGIPPGTYQLAMWDKPINEIIDFRTVTIAAGQHVDMGDVPIFGWFANFTGHVFYDANGTGLPPGGVPLNPSQARGIPNVPINLHYTDGSMYQTTTTDSAGAFTFSTYVSWWRFLVAEVGVGLGKPTGLSCVVDNGGALPPITDPFGALGINPQVQANGALFRSEAGDLVGTRRLSGPVTEAFNLYQDMTGYVAFGTGNWDVSRGENGGIRGFIDYATTRTEEDPKTSASDGWEPGVPNVTVLLHKAKQDCTADGASMFSNCWVIDDASDSRFPQVTKSDSWNDNIPEGCVGFPGPGDRELVNGFTIHPCAETFINWDQTRPGVFDGAFAFDVLRDAAGTPLTSGGNPIPIPPGNYIVEMVPPPGYQVLFWGDRNIEFGDPKIPFLTQPPDCVGPDTEVPQFHTLFPDQQVETDTSQSGLLWSPGMTLPYCNKKVLPLNPGATAVVNFNVFTQVPKAGRIWGTVWNDLMLEFNPKSPNAAGNLGVSYLPVSIRDWSGTEVARFYTDQWGHFDGLVPTNYDIAPPIPIGLVLNMLTILPNDPGPILDTRVGSATSGQWITDPWFNPAYSQEVIRENWEFYPGRTTFIDTIVIPVAGFVGNRVPLNCAYTDRTPEILQVDKVLLPSTGSRTVVITSKGTVQVPNPAFDPTATSGPTSQALVSWDHSFGPQVPGSRVSIGGVDVPATNIVSWTAPGANGVNSITVNVPGTMEGQLVVTRGDSGLSTTVGVTLHNTGAIAALPACAALATTSPGYCFVDPPPGTCTGLACARIQPAIDRVFPGTTIVVNPGKYQENINLWKPITLQGKGASVTQFDNTAATANLALKNAAFNQLQTLEANGAIAIVPGQASDFTLERGAGILVGGCGTAATCGPAGSPVNTSFFKTGAVAQIDGITITGASEAGGGILINGYVNGLRITNDEILANQGNIGGGIRAGESLVVSSFNPNLLVDHNRIAQNGSFASGGGGLALYSGTDGYQVSNNFICGNFSQQYGGGIGHFGLSDGTRPAVAYPPGTTVRSTNLMAGNVIVSNESADEGGGIHIGGENAAGAVALTAGAGSVIINRNLIQGNKSGDDGGGIRTRRFNGLDVASRPTLPATWFSIDIYNNMIVNNSSADHGGGLAFDDTVRANVVGNTVARNDSTATGSDAFGGPCTENSPIGQLCPAPEGNGGLTTSNPQVAGISSIGHTTALLNALRATGSFCAANLADPQCAVFSNPLLKGNIVWQNRSFYWDATANGNLGGLVLASGAALPGGYWDFAVYGTPTPQTLSPTYSMLTNGIGATPSGTNQVTVNPNLVSTYFNVYQATSKGSALGNFVVATFTPNGVQGNYHIPVTSLAVGRGDGLTPGLNAFDYTLDYDGDTRVVPVDVGADQTAAPRPAALAGGGRTGAAALWSSRLLPAGHAADSAIGPRSTRLDFLDRWMGMRSGVSVSASALDFGAVARGSTSSPQLLTIRNGTDSDVTVTRSWAGDDQFRALVDGKPWSGDGRTVPAHGSLVLSVTYAPHAGASPAANGLLTLHISGAAIPTQRVSLAGTAQ